MATSQSKYVPPLAAPVTSPLPPPPRLPPREEHPQGSTLTWFAYKGEDGEEMGRSSPLKDSSADLAPSTADLAPSAADLAPSAADPTPFNADFTPSTADFTPSTAVTSSPLPTTSAHETTPTPKHPLHYLISYITVFPRAHPLWEDEHELWSHSSMEKLIADWEGPKKNFGRPIPVFSPANKANYHTIFSGWWVIDSIHVAEPRSSEVNDMMKIKEKNGAFSRSGRTAQAWDESMGYTWVRIRLSKCTKEGLRNATTLGEGQGEKYLLEVGGLDEELKVLEKATKQHGLPDLAALNVADDGEGDDEK